MRDWNPHVKNPKIKSLLRLMISRDEFQKEQGRALLEALGMDFFKVESGGDLSRAKFSNADLSGADFSGMDLQGCSFVGCDLSGADFKDANLVGSEMTMIKMANTDFSGANMDGVSLTVGGITSPWRFQAHDDLVGGAKIFGTNLTGMYADFRYPGPDFYDPVAGIFLTQESGVVFDDYFTHQAPYKVQKFDKYIRIHAGRSRPLSPQQYLDEEFDGSLDLFAEWMGVIYFDSTTNWPLLDSVRNFPYQTSQGNLVTG
jgi:hypothetical protein